MPYDDFYGGEYFSGTAGRGSFLVIRYDRVLLSIRLNGTEAELPGILRRAAAPILGSFAAARRPLAWIRFSISNGQLLCINHQRKPNLSSPQYKGLSWPFRRASSWVAKSFLP